MKLCESESYLLRRILTNCIEISRESGTIFSRKLTQIHYRNTLTLEVLLYRHHHRFRISKLFKHVVKIQKSILILWISSHSRINPENKVYSRNTRNIPPIITFGRNATYRSILLPLYQTGIFGVSNMRDKIKARLTNNMIYICLL